MLVPLMVRRLIPTASIAFFLHIPFPSSEIFRCLHVRKEILQGLLGADLIGFQTYAYMRHFLMTCTRLLALDTSPKGIQLENSVVSLGIYPIGIDLAAFNVKRRHPDVARIIAALSEKYAGMHIVIGRDKNDYVKGVRHKLLAFERFLSQFPQWQGRVVLIQVGLSTTEANELETHVTDIAARINSRFGAIGYVPVVYLQQDISFNHYLALLTIADACLITSLRDGMNLTSHEYVVCQEEKHSPLIISEFAGTYGSFGAAIRVNPWDGQEVAKAINDALTMSPEEKRYRWNMLFNYVSTNTAQAFVETFVSDAVRVHEENMMMQATSIPRLAFEDLSDAYLASRRRIFFLDDEGTLFSTTASQGTHAVAHQDDQARVKALLARLCADPLNIVYLVSGRTRAELEHFIDVPRLGISAENGCFIKFADKSRWEAVLQDQDFSWRKKVLEVFEYYTDRTPGSYIEQKEIGVVWHYGRADINFGSWQAAECQNHLQNTVTASYPIHSMTMKKSVEVMMRNVSKATAVRRILEHHQGRSQRRRHSSNSPRHRPHTHHHHSHLAHYAHHNQHAQSSPSAQLYLQGTSLSHAALIQPSQVEPIIAPSPAIELDDSAELPASGNELQPLHPSLPMHPHVNATSIAVPVPARTHPDAEYDQSDRATISTLGTSYPGADAMSIASADESHGSSSWITGPQPHGPPHMPPQPQPPTLVQTGVADAHGSVGPLAPIATCLAASAPATSYMSTVQPTASSAPATPTTPSSLALGAATPVTGTPGARHERIDFILCIGDDRCDEYMFEYLSRVEMRDRNKERSRDRDRERARSDVSSLGPAASGTASAASGMSPAWPTGRTRVATPRPDTDNDDAQTADDGESSVAAGGGGVPTTPGSVDVGVSEVPGGVTVPLVLGASAFDGASDDMGDNVNTAAAAAAAANASSTAIATATALATAHVGGAQGLPVTPARTPVARPQRTIVTCTVGAKSSSAKWFVPAVSGVMEGLEYLCGLEAAVGQPMSSSSSSSLPLLQQQASQQQQQQQALQPPQRDGWES
ncbi:Trehalose-6-P synthase/phosphatase complex subunit [Polyrhizophydium stewartii]|uniref:Trehalose-6-P synthase/phosphatase complex subunit n=1 Tax=Polyrhizophydium stewartii TaxID=2732419 RepID=A0ABR4NDS7_9FUNG